MPGVNSETVKVSVFYSSEASSKSDIRYPFSQLIITVITDYSFLREAPPHQRANWAFNLPSKVLKISYFILNRSSCFSFPVLKRQASQVVFKQKSQMARWHAAALTRCEVISALKTN